MLWCIVCISVFFDKSLVGQVTFVAEACLARVFNDGYTYRIAYCMYREVFAYRWQHLFVSAEWYIYRDVLIVGGNTYILVHMLRCILHKWICLY